MCVLIERLVLFEVKMVESLGDEEYCEVDFVFYCEWEEWKDIIFVE